MSMTRGIVTAGHPLTAAAARDLLEAGGNAFDAALGALCTACVVEPALASLGGGGFLLARPAGGPPCVYDFFVQTPAKPCPAGERDFRAVVVDFGDATQEFHIGRGSVAVPGVVRGVFAVHADLASLPIADIFSPAIGHARDGATVNRFQAYTIRLLEPIFTATPATAGLLASPDNPHALVDEGDLHRQPALADAMEAIAREGAALFYRGEIAHAMAGTLADGGHLRGTDLAAYRVEKRAPLLFRYRGTKILSNPPPSSGGLLIAFTLALLERDAGRALPALGSGSHITRMATAMDLTSQARIDAAVAGEVPIDAAQRLLDPGYLALWRERLAERLPAYRGTTHINVIDARGNIASLSVSNGEGSACVVPSTGIALNNMLGEADLNPHGFHRWAGGQRMTSMMAPSIAVGPGERVIAIGSGGSNRIRTAITQVLLNLLDHALDVTSAVDSPRVHFENGLLDVEGGFDHDRIAGALSAFPRHKLWRERNMFFGGAHTVMWDGNRFSGAGDPRRAGTCLQV